MDYTTILHALNQASLFDLHRLQSAITQELDNPKRLEQIKRRLKIGQIIHYFEPQSNDLIEAEILTMQIKRCLVRNTLDKKRWNIPFYFINLDNADTDIQPPKAVAGIPRQSLKAGAKVGFRNGEERELFGEVIRLNPKTATVRVNGGGLWRVYYHHLFPVIEGESADLNFQGYIAHES